MIGTARGEETAANLGSALISRATGELVECADPQGRIPIDGAIMQEIDAKMRFVSRWLFLAALLVASSVGLAEAGIGVWTSNGPEGGFIQTLAIDPTTPSTLYVGTDGGVFKSTDGGGSWSVANTGLSATNVSALAIDPVTPTTLYAGAAEGFFKSTNGGGSWSAVNAGLTDPDTSYVYSLAIDPVTPTTLYAGTEDGVFKSTNGGGSWNAVNTGLTSVEALAIDRVTPTTLYAGDFFGGVFKSINGGGSWSAVETGLTNTRVYALTIDPATPSTLYAGTRGGVFKSTDGGGGWSAINTGLTDIIVYTLAIDPATPDTLYAGTNGGGVFALRAPPLFDYTLGNSGDITVTQGGTGATTIVATLTVGPPQSVSFSASGLPTFTGITASFDPGACTATCPTQLTISTTGSTPAGTFPVTVTGRPLDRTTSFNVVVRAQNGMSVTSPNGGETWAIGSARTIAWTSSALTGNVKIDLSRNGGTSWAPVIGSTPNDGSHPWAVTGPPTAQARIRITSLTDPTATDASNANFTIGGGSSSSLTVTSPNGGETWPIGASRAIQWTSVGLTGNVKIEVSRNGGTSWAPVIGSTPNDGTHAWTVTGAATTQARIRITSLTDPTIADVSDANFTIGGGSITVTRPNGREAWPIGSSQTIQWTSTGLTGNVRVEASRNGGTTWALIAGNTSNNGAFNWTVTGPATTQARIRVTSLTDPTVADASDANFTIGGGSLTVTAPNGGETWPIASTQNISWISSGLTGNVKIELSRSGGAPPWSLIIASTPNDGTHSWVVTGPTTTQARIRVTSVTDPTVTDVSDANAALQ